MSVVGVPVCAVILFGAAAGGWLDWSFAWYALFATVLVEYKHIPNIRRLLAGTEPRSVTVATDRRLADVARYGVLGATSWGVTLAALLERSGNEVVVLTRTAQEAEQVDGRRGLERLPDLRLGGALPFRASRGPANRSMVLSSPLPPSTPHHRAWERPPAGYNGPLGGQGHRTADRRPDERGP